MKIAQFKFTGCGNLASQIESANLSGVDRINLSIPKSLGENRLRNIIHEVARAETELDLEIRVVSEDMDVGN